MGFGQSLRSERERRQWSLAQVSEATKVSERHLQALEQDDWDHLPGGVFNRGFVQGYCRALGLDEQTWLDRYAAAHPAEEHDWQEFAQAVKRGRGQESSVGYRWWGVVALLIALAALAWAAWHFVIRQRVGRPATAPDTQHAQSLPQ